MSNKEASRSDEYRTITDATSLAKSALKKSSNLDMLPGTVATRSISSFYGYPWATTLTDAGSGSADTGHRRFFDTMASYFHLQDSVDRAAMEEQAERIRKEASMDCGGQSFASERHVNTNVLTSPDSTGEKDVDLLATALKELLTSDDAQRRIGSVHAGSPAVGNRVLSDEDLKKLL